MESRDALRLRFCCAGLAGILSGCGGGGSSSSGGGGGGSAIITGQVLLVSSNAAPATTATVSSGGVTATANAADGSFTLSNVPSSATSLTISVAQTGGASPLVRTLPIALTANQTAALGAIYVGGTGYNATVTGRVVTAGAGGVTQGVGNATVTIAGVQVQTSANPATLGQFTVSGLPVGLGSDLGVLLGTVQASGFASYQLITNTANLNFPTGLISGSNSIGDITILQPSGSTPAPPYTVTGQVTVAGTGAPNQTVVLTQNGTFLGSVTTDSSGNYFFWVVAGTYTVQATRSAGGQTQTTSVTLTAVDQPVTAPTINFAQ